MLRVQLQTCHGYCESDHCYDILTHTTKRSILICLKVKNKTATLIPLSILCSIHHHPRTTYPSISSTASPIAFNNLS